MLQCQIFTIWREELKKRSVMFYLQNFTAAHFYIRYMFSNVEEKSNLNLICVRKPQNEICSNKFNKGKFSLIL